MAKTYRIDLQVNNSQADAAARKSVASLASVEKASERTAVAQERRAAREAASFDRNALRAVRAADKAADASVKATERAARQKMSIEDRLLSRENSRMIAGERAAQRAADSAVRAKEREVRQVQAIEDRYLKRDLKDRMKFDLGRKTEGAGLGWGGRASGTSASRSRTSPARWPSSGRSGRPWSNPSSTSTTRSSSRRDS